MNEDARATYPKRNDSEMKELLEKWLRRGENEAEAMLDPAQGRGEDTKRNFKHAKRLQRRQVPGCEATETDLDRGEAMFPSDNCR